ncbi:MAG TPA: hypothetical protein VLO11_08565 [Luteolibacter sp.]|nr:hypothetical protein [Luteolibacter sp.]
MPSREIFRGFARIVEYYMAGKTTLPAAMNDSELDQLLKNSDPGAGMHPGFQREVWLRIQTSQSQGWKPAIRRFYERIAESLTLPSVAAATCAAAVLAGVVLGLMPGKSDVSDDSAYLRSVSPFVQTARR